MKTPYCAAVRTLRREVDQIKSSIAAERQQLALLEGRANLMRERMQAERDIVSQDWQASSAYYFLRVRDELAALQAERNQTDARLSDLRDKAREAFGTFRAVENAADDYRTDAMRKAEAAEQAAMDDRVAAQFLHVETIRRVAVRKRAA